MVSRKRRRRRGNLHECSSEEGSECSSEEESDYEDCDDALWRALRKVQRETSCSTKTLLSTLRAITPFLKVDVVSNGKKHVRS